MSSYSVDRSAQRKLADVQAPWVTGVTGLSIIGSAFLISIINASIDTPNTFISATLQPFIFVGLGLLLYHVGQHVHAMNQNVILMVEGMSQAEQDTPGS